MPRCELADYPAGQPAPISSQREPATISFLIGTHIGQVVTGYSELHTGRYRIQIHIHIGNTVPQG